MNARTLAVIALSTAIGAFAWAPVRAQDAMAASSSTAMPHDAMHSSGAMKGSMHEGGMKMKQDAMKPGAMKPGAMKPAVMKHGAMKSGAMQHHGMKMKQGDAMKMKRDAAGAMSSGG